MLYSSCKVCGSHARIIGGLDTGKGCLPTSPFIPSGEVAHYFTCKVCGLTFTRYFDNYTPEDWSTKVYNSDYSLYDPEYVSIRSEQNIAIVPQILKSLGIAPKRSLDYGSGSGIFAKGIGAEEYDPFSHKTPPNGVFDLITCFEVAEHHTDPTELFIDLTKYLDTGGFLLMSTLTINRPSISHWYIGPRNGHISIYNKKTLEVLAARVGLKVRSLDDGTHIFRKV